MGKSINGELATGLGRQSSVFQNGSASISLPFALHYKRLCAEIDRREIALRGYT